MEAGKWDRSPWSKANINIKIDLHDSHSALGTNASLWKIIPSNSDRYSIISLDVVSCFMMEVTAIQIQILDSGLLEAINKPIGYWKGICTVIMALKDLESSLENGFAH